eukprot:jgi/Hompol1/5578/HPOL_004552-RA
MCSFERLDILLVIDIQIQVDVNVDVDANVQARSATKNETKRSHAPQPQSLGGNRESLSAGQRQRQPAVLLSHKRPRKLHDPLLQLYWKSAHLLNDPFTIVAAIFRIMFVLMSMFVLLTPLLLAAGLVVVVVVVVDVTLLLALSLQLGIAA